MFTPVEGNTFAITSSPNMEPRVLNSWKEIAAYLGRGVRTVQRYERNLRLPVRRPAGQDRSAVLALADELDEWLKRAPMKDGSHTRSLLVLLESAGGSGTSARQVALQTRRFHVLSAFSCAEVTSIAERIDVDGFVLEHDPADKTICEFCRTLKEHYPQKPIVVISEVSLDGEAPKNVDYVVEGSEPERLADVAVEIFGTQP